MQCPLSKSSKRHSYTKFNTRRHKPGIAAKMLNKSNCYKVEKQFLLVSVQLIVLLKSTSNIKSNFEEKSKCMAKFKNTFKKFKNHLQCFLKFDTLNRKTEECTLTLCSLSLTFNLQVKHQWKGNEMFFWEWVVVFGGSA